MPKASTRSRSSSTRKTATSTKKSRSRSASSKSQSRRRSAGQQAGATRQRRRSKSGVPRAKTAFALFTASNYHEVAARHPNLPAPEIIRHLARMWAETDQTPWHEQAAKDKERAAKQRAAEKSQKSFDGRTNPWLKFSIATRKRVQAEHPDWSFGKVSAEVGRRWRAQGGGSSAGRKKSAGRKRKASTGSRKRTTTATSTSRRSKARRGYDGNNDEGGEEEVIEVEEEEEFGNGGSEYAGEFDEYNNSDYYEEM